MVYSIVKPNLAIMKSFRLVYSMSRFLACFAVLTTSALYAQDYAFVLDQAEDIPLLSSQFAAEYQRDLNENIGTSFLYTVQSGMKCLNRNEFSIILVGGADYLGSDDISRPTELGVNSIGNYSFTTGIPTVFNDVEGSELIYQFIDPDTGGDLVDPGTGDKVRLSVGLPDGLGLDRGATPAGTIGIGYGVGANTSIYVNFTPMLFSSLGDQFDGLSIESDYAFGAHLKHDFGSWIDFFSSRNIHASISVGYNAYSMSGTSSAIVPTVVELSNDYELQASGADLEFSTSISTIGSRLELSRSYGFIELAIFGDYVQNNYETTSDGDMQVSIVNTSSGVTDEERTLSNFSDYDGSSSSMGGGATLTLGQGWFRGVISYRHSAVANVSFGLLFHLNSNSGSEG